MKEKGFIRSAGIVSAGTFFSRVTGLVRLQVIAYLFGYSQATDAFWLAFTLPNLLRALFAEGALSSAFIPVFSEYCATGKKEEALRLANSIIFFLLLITGLITACGVIFAPFYMPYFGIGFRENTQQLNLAILLTQIMWPFLIFISLAAISMAILNCWGHFSSPAFAPLFFNLSLIVCGALLISRFGIFSLAAGVVLGGILQFLVQLPSLKKRGFKFKLILSLKDEGTKKVLRLILPAILGNLTLQISVAITRVFASTLPEGSISGLQYAMRLIQFPLGIFPIALSTAIFPRLSVLFSLNDMEGVKKTFLVGVRTLSFLLIPSSFGIILLREEIVRVLFQHGAFSFRDTLLTSQALLCYTIGLFAMGVLMVVTRTFYSLQDISTPVKVFFFSVLLNIFLNFVLIGPLKHQGLALSTSLSVIFNVGVLFSLLRKKIGKLEGVLILKSILKITFACGVMAAGILLLRSFFIHQVGVESFYILLLFLCLSLISGAGIFILTSHLLGIEELKIVFSALKHERKKGFDFCRH